MSFAVYSPPPMPADEAAREAEVLASGLTHADVTIRLHDFVEQAAMAIGTTMAALTLIYRDRQLIIAATGMSVGRTSRATSFCGHAILRPDEIMCVPDTLRDERFAENPNVIDEPHIRFYVGAPLRTATGHALGTLCAFDPEPRHCVLRDEASRLRGLADQIMDFARR